jgi:cobyrinic acid a,c-diamide synthase
MSIEDIRALKHSEPFSPFTIVMKNGQAVWISGQERIALSPTGKTIAVAEGSAFSFLVVDRIDRIEPNSEPRLPSKRIRE